MTATSEREQMTLQQANGRGFVLFGSHPETGKWFERWYATKEDAESYAAKRGWKIKDK